MVTQFHKILIAALGLQIVLGAVVLTRGRDSAALREHPIVAGFDAAKVTRLQVFAGAEAKPIDLVKKDANWVMASGFDYPVEATKVTDALSPIAKIAAAAPIATQSARHKQLHVADTDFERKLVITANGKDLTLFIGGSAGARRTAVRLGGDDSVYAVMGLTASTVGGEPKQWIDPSYVKIAREDVRKVSVQRDGKTVELARVAEVPPAGGSGSGAGSGSAVAAAAAGSAAGSGSGAGSGSNLAPAVEHWAATIAGAPVTPAAGETLDEAAFDRLVGQIVALDITAPADPKRDASRPTATITIERKPSGGTTPAATVVDIVADGTSYWVHDRALPRAGVADKARLDDLLGADRDKLISKPAPPTPPKGAAGASIPGLPPGVTLPPGVQMPPMPRPPAGGAPHPG
jgi:hypothetical protein